MASHRSLRRLFLQATGKRAPRADPTPLLVELLTVYGPTPTLTYQAYPFSYQVSVSGRHRNYAIGCDLSQTQILAVREAARWAAEALDPDSVTPLTFERLAQVLSQHAARNLGDGVAPDRVNDLAELAAYDSIGLSRILALAKDPRVTEFYVDSETSPIYVDHIDAGRCDTNILLTARERGALETHLDTFRGYTLDYKTPSLKNDLEISKARLRISLDLEPLSVNRFALDARRLGGAGLSINELIRLNVITLEAAGFVTAWLESGGNVTIVGETGTGKTTLLNALDEMVEPKLRRLYIEDAVETRDLLGRGYHQMKIKVDPFDRGGDSSRTKESEIVKALHRSPDIVILSEIQSEEHSRAFFHSLSAGVRGIQTFHASSVEQAIRRWVLLHKIPQESLIDLGLIVQMVRPSRLEPGRYVQRICEVVKEEEVPRVRDLFTRDRDFALRKLREAAAEARVGLTPVEFARRVEQVRTRLSQEGRGKS